MVSSRRKTRAHSVQNWRFGQTVAATPFKEEVGRRCFNVSGRGEARRDLNALSPFLLGYGVWSIAKALRLEAQMRVTTRECAEGAALPGFGLGHFKD